ncbi:MAG: Fe-S protein assembly co-chaperone HscB [Deltaproteobacteria bacterium]|nr:Fe-S protein assembly co-chaperone HscB [Deltaproteobacteria bacterium]
MVSPSTSDPFGLLGLPPRFDVDPATLERAFFERSKEVHADKFATAPAAERVAALSRSRALNDAYQLLRREASRAEYLLARAGVTIGANERVDPSLLMEFLEERERLSEARVAGRLAEVEELQTKMRARRAEAMARVRADFAAEAPKLDDIKQQLILLRYVDRYLDECDAALDD